MSNHLLYVVDKLLIPRIKLKIIVVNWINIQKLMTTNIHSLKKQKEKLILSNNHNVN